MYCLLKSSTYLFKQKWPLINKTHGLITDYISDIDIDNEDRIIFRNGRV